MNSLSIFLYLIDVLDGVADFAAFMAIISFVASLLGAAIFIVATSEANKKHRSDEQREEDRKLAKSSKPWLKRAILTFFIVSVIVLLIPSQKTMYLIMGSEVSQEIINSETGKRVQNAINKKLDEYLGEPE